MLRFRAVTAVRRSASCIVLVLAATAAASTAPQRTLNINLATSQELSAVSTGALVAEVNAIWWHSNLSLAWRTADVSEPLPAMPDSEDWLRVLVLARHAPGAGDAATFAVGELVRYENARPLAIASLTAARRVVDESLKFVALEDQRDYDNRLGVVLGRAVAHEIGHYLLGTSGHATQGLMRASIDAQEFADIHSRSFRLDRVARAHLARLADAPLSKVPGFSYASR
jgi:hypothetical protein